MDWTAITAAARRAAAAYTEDLAQARAAFEALGLTFLGQYKNASHQAVVSRGTDGRFYLSISGTRFGRSVGDLFCDADIVGRDLDNGCRVSAGAFEGMLGLWDWAQSWAPAGTVWNVEGHSLGGQRALFTGVFLPAERIGAVHAFEAPKGANGAFWQRYALANAVCVVNGADLWFGWPLISDWQHPPRDHIWLQGDMGGYTVIQPENWPRGLDADDHSIDLVVSRLVRIAGVPV